MADLQTDRTTSPWVVTSTVLAGAFAIGINFTILAVSRPAIARDLNVDVSTLVWLISGPILANALVTPAAGKLGDLRGHRQVFLAGLWSSAFFAIASAFAPNAFFLVAFRVLGAVSGAAAGPASLAMINLSFKPTERSKAMGYWSLVAAGGPVIGLIIGGPLVDAVGWRWIFGAQVPLLAIAALIGHRVLPESPRKPHVRFDLAGNLALAVSVFALLLAVERGGSWGWGSTRVLGLVGFGLIALAVFIRIEQRVTDPLIPLEYFKRSGFSAPVGVQFFTQFGYMGGFILAPKLLDEVGGLSASEVSKWLIPRPLTFAIAGALIGFVLPRLGIRRLAMLGNIAVVISMLMVAWGAADTSMWFILGAIALSGLGMGALQPTVATSVANSVDDADLGVAGATQQMSAQIATSAGMNLMDSIQVSLVGTAGLVGSYERAYQYGAVITAAGCVLALALPKRVSPRTQRVS